MTNKRKKVKGIGRYFITGLFAGLLIILSGILWYYYDPQLNEVKLKRRALQLTMVFFGVFIFLQHIYDLLIYMKRKQSEE